MEGQLSALSLDPNETGLEFVLSRIQDIAVLPQVVFKVVDLTGSTDSSARQMEAVIVVDPGFSAKLLTMANSAYYGLPRKVTSIRDAITFLGFRAVRQLAMTMGVFELFLGKTDAESLRRRAWWRQSVDTGVCARWIASQVPGLNAEECYTCGLLHYVGKTLLDQSNPERFEFYKAAREAGYGDRQSEHVAYGCDHIEVASAVGAKWGFPEELTAGLNYDDEAPPDDPHRTLKACTCIAHHIAHLTVMGKAKVPEEGEDEPLALPAWAMDALNLTAQRAETFVLEGSAAIRSAAQLPL